MYLCCLCCKPSYLHLQRIFFQDHVVDSINKGSRNKFQHSRPGTTRHENQLLRKCFEDQQQLSWDKLGGKSLQLLLACIYGFTQCRQIDIAKDRQSIRATQHKTIRGVRCIIGSKFTKFDQPTYWTYGQNCFLSFAIIFKGYKGASGSGSYSSTEWQSWSSSDPASKSSSPQIDVGRPLSETQPKKPLIVTGISAYDTLYEWIYCHDVMSYHYHCHIIKLYYIVVYGTAQSANPPPHPPLVPQHKEGEPPQPV